MSTYSINRINACLAVVLVAIQLTARAEIQSARTVPELKPGEPVSQELSGNQAHTYRVTLSAGQYLCVVVNQLGCDAVLRILTVDGRQVAETSTPTGPRGPEFISLVAESSADYLVEVRNLDKAVSAGRYEISIEELRTANAQDKLDTVAERSYFSGPYFTASVDSLKRTIARYEKLLPELHVEVDPRGRAEALTSKGRLHIAAGDSQRCLDCLNQALSIWRSIGDRSAEALTLHSIGEVHVRRSGTQEALAHYNQALKLQQETGDRHGQARTLRSIGIAYGDSGNLSRAIDYHHQSLSVSVENSLDSLLANHFISGLYSSLGETQLAFQYASRALTLSQAGDYHPYIHYMLLRQIGAIHRNLGETQKAIDCLNRRLVLSRSLGLESQYTTTLETARLYRSLGEDQRAGDLYSELLELARATRVSTREAQALTIIADWYKDSNEKQKATDYYNRALAIWQNTFESRRRIGNVQGDAITLRIIADTFHKMGELKKAIDFYKQSLALFQSKGNEDSEATINQIIGSVYAESGEMQPALDHYNKALMLSRGLGNPGKEASVLKAIGSLQLTLGDKQKALDHFRPALPLLRASGKKAEEAEVNYHIARIERDSGNIAEAVRRIDAALDIVESLRTKIDLNELRASYFSRIRSYYEFHVDLLMELHQQQPARGYADAALKASESARARSFLEMLAESAIDVSQELSLEQRERENRIFANIATIQKELWNDKLPPGREQQLNKELAEAENNLEAFRLELRRTNPRYSSIQYPKPFDTRLIQAGLDADTALIEYALGEKQSFAWVVSREKVTAAVLPPRKEIEERVAAYRQTLTGKVSALSINQALKQYESQSSQLYQSLVQPLENALSAPKKLIIVPDGALAYLPFETLLGNSNTQPLLERFSISYLPSASSLVAIRTGDPQRGNHSKSLIAFGDPVYEPGGEPGVKPDPFTGSNRKLYAERGFDFNRLPYTRDEVVAIGSLFSETRRQVYLGERALEQTVKSEKLEDYRYVHFAAHGMIDEQRPARSGIALSMNGSSKEDGVLQMSEIMRLKLDADLVTLSACRTGLGKLLNGEGMVGLSRAFFYAGAKSVVVSLWNVNDIATAELMKAFYRNLNKGMSKDDALRDAKLTLINGRQRTWRHPYFWAPFVLAGSPK